MKLVKLSETHYVITDDSEVNDEICLRYVCDIPYVMKYDKDVNKQFNITHSTEPLEPWRPLSDIINSVKSVEINIGGVQPLSLLEVEEVIYRYSVEKIACEKADVSLKWYADKNNKDRDESLVFYADGIIEGFRAHRELTKDKLFTIEDMDKAYIQGRCDESTVGNKRKMREKYLQSLLPKTEWNIKITPEGKIKLL